MADYDEMLKEFSETSRERLRAVWDSLPAEVQRDLIRMPQKFPGGLAQLKALGKMALTQFRMAFGDKSAIAILGPANVGKSTLYNQLIERKADRAEVSPVPGTTRESRSADAGLFAVVDTPGADAVGEVGETEKERAFATARDSDLLIIMFDAVQGIKKTEHELFEQLAALGAPYLVVLNKMDLARGAQKEVLGMAAASLNLAPEQMLGISARNGKDVERVLVAIAKSEPAIMAALGQALPEYRWRLAWTAITGAASTSAVIALTPLPMLDFIPLIAIQCSLVLGIARIYNFKITPARARELVATFGLGYLGRTLFQELSKLGGPPGWVLSAAIATSTTVVMGYAAIAWFEQGEKLSRESLKQLTSTLTAFLVETLKSLGKRRPERKKLRERVADALAASPMAQERDKASIRSQ